MVRVERGLAHKRLGDSPHERVDCLLDIEVQVPWLCASEFDVSRQVTPHDPHLLVVFADQTTHQFDGAHATIKGVIEAI